MRHIYIKVPYIFQRYTNHLQILGAREVAWNKFNAEYWQILGATGQNLRTPDLRVSGENKSICNLLALKQSANTSCMKWN